MRIGYTILQVAPGSQESEFARFLKDTLILEEGYADNIAKVLFEGSSINIYTQRNLDDLLGNVQSPYNFRVDFVYIETKNDDEYIVASAVDFRLEIPLEDEIKVLTPTEYFVTTESLARTLTKEIEQGLLKVFPSLPDIEGADWILNKGKWRDSGVWMDEKEWKDR